jgi:hypothetical protein
VDRVVNGDRILVGLRGRKRDEEQGNADAVVFEGMTLTREEGRTVPAGPVRDQAELQGLLQHVSALGLTLLEATAVEAGAKR